MEFNFLKNDRGLFVFSDPGGAKPLLSFIKIYKPKEFRVISDRDYNFFLDFGIDIFNYKDENIEKLIKDFNPLFVFTGTSYTSKLELRFIKAAEKLNINTFSYIDHYTNYKERFFLENHYVFPKNIILIDQVAKEIAIKTHLTDHSTLYVMNNFYHEFLRNWKPKKIRENILNNHKIRIDQKIIVFAPDPISNIKIENKYLFDENDVWDDLVYVLRKFNSKKLILIVQLHPNQKKNTLINAIKRNSFNNVFLFDQNDLIDLIYYADIIVGMFSSILIEADIFNTKIIRHFPKKIYNDPLSKFNFGLVSYSKNQLYANLKDCLIN